MLKIHNQHSSLLQNHTYTYLNVKNIILICSIREGFTMSLTAELRVVQSATWVHHRFINIAAIGVTHNLPSQPHPPSRLRVGGGKSLILKRYPYSHSSFHDLSHSNPLFFKNFLLFALPFLCRGHPHRQTTQCQGFSFAPGL